MCFLPQFLKDSLSKWSVFASESHCFTGISNSRIFYWKFPVNESNKGTCIAAVILSAITNKILRYYTFGGLVLAHVMLLVGRQRSFRC